MLAGAISEVTPHATSKVQARVSFLCHTYNRQLSTGDAFWCALAQSVWAMRA